MNPPDSPFFLPRSGIWTWFVQALLFQKCISSKWREQGKGSKKFVLFSKQAVSRWMQDTGPNLLHPSLLTLPFLWNFPGWQEEAAEREENSYCLQWERFDRFPHILTWQHSAHREEREVFFSKITVCQDFLSGETLYLLTSGILVSLRG